MNAADISAVIAAIGAVVVAVTGLLKVLKELRTNTAITQETHALVNKMGESESDV
jgi:hypothetical protein